MDTAKQINLTELAPAYLWVGQSTILLEKALPFLQTIFCKNNGCGVCITCQQIRTQQHYGITWLYPEKQYTIDQLTPIFEKITFQNELNQHHFFVVQKADFLTQSCANALLKPVEEPPPGYHFLFLTERPDLLLPTIRSRCVITNYKETETQINHPLFDFFTSTKPADPFVFAKELQASKMHPRESVELLDALLAFWIAKYKKTQTTKTQNIVTLIQNHMKTPPMPGGDKLFWRNLFLQMKQ